MIYIPNQWIDMARRHHGIIAGGCLRDTILGKPMKDVDIFVEGLIQAEDANAYMNGYKVENLTYGGFDYQICKHRFGSDFMSTFDLGICKVSYDPVEGYVFSQDFVQDIAKRTITVLRTDMPNHEEHLARVVAKYPDFTIVTKMGLFD